MSIELVTGKAGVPHISGDDIGVFQAAAVGFGLVRLPTTSIGFPEASVQSANSVLIPAMNVLIDGRLVRILTNETVTLSSGTVGMRRIDLVCLRYSRASSGVETVSLTVLKGAATSGTPTPPTPTGSIISGSSTAYYALASVTINGITPSQPVMLGSTHIPASQAPIACVQSDGSSAGGYGSYTKYTSWDWKQITMVGGMTLRDSALVIPADGIYELGGFVYWDSDVTGDRGAALMINDTLLFASMHPTSISRWGVGINAPTMIATLKAGDRVSIAGMQTSSNSRAVNMIKAIITVRYLRGA